MKKIDVTKDHCPMTFVKVKVALGTLAPGETLEVLLSPGEPLENVPKSAEEEGHRILDVHEVDGNYRVVIEKKAGLGTTAACQIV